MKEYLKRKNENFSSLNFVADENDNGKTVFSLLKRNGVSLSLIRSQKHHENGILLNGKEVYTIETVKTGDTVTLRIPNDTKTAVSSDIFVNVCYEDENVIVMDKPAGMTVHPVKDYRTNTLANAFANHMAKKGKSYAFRPVNRLDKDTSGLVLATFDRFSAAKLAGKTDKIYYAICHGKTDDFGTIDAPLGRKEGHGICQEVRDDGKTAVTYYKTVKTNGEYSLVEVKIDTGRLHQIRAHFSHIGHPLLGDDMYGGSLEKIKRQALHCKILEFVHPITGEQTRVETEMPEDMQNLIAEIFL